MAHVLILRECPSFTQARGLIQGTHEEIESEINKRKYEFNGARQGYNIPSSSTLIPMNYRIKEECIPEFLRDLGIVNLNPKKLPKGLWKELLLPRFLMKNDSGVNRWVLGIGRTRALIILLSRFLPFLHGCDIAEGERKPFTTKWNYNYYVGYLKDIRRNFGEEL